jgi:hypothetical protein
MQIWKCSASLRAVRIDRTGVITPKEWTRFALDIGIARLGLGNIPPNKVFRLDTQCACNPANILCRDCDFFTPTTIATVQTIDFLKG